MQEPTTAARVSASQQPVSARLRWVARHLPELAAGAAVGFTAASFAGPLHWWLDLFSHFRVQYALVLLAAFPLLLLRRRWLLLAAGLGALAANLSILAPHARTSPLHRPTPEHGPQVRCLSFNVLQGNERWNDGAAFVRQSGADAAVFQEVTPEWGAALDSLRDVYPHRLICGKTDSKGYALLSRHPVENLRFEELPGYAPIGAVIAEVNAPQPFTILGIHSHKPTSRSGAASQRFLFDWLVEKCAAERAKGRPVVLMGDFNATPWCRAFREFAARDGLLDTSRGVTIGATWSAWLPQRMIIDHGFVSPEWRLLSRRVGPCLGSDHRPLILDLAIPR